MKLRRSPSRCCPEFEPHRARARRARHRFQSLPPRHVPENARGLFPYVATPFRVSAARLRRVHDVFRFLQKSVSGDQRPDGGAHGGRHRSGDLPPGRGAAAAGADAPSNSEVDSISASGVPERSCSPPCRNRAEPGQAWLEELDRVARSLVQHQRRATASITTTARGTTILPCPSPHFPVNRESEKWANGSSGRPKN